MSIRLPQAKEILETIEIMLGKKPSLQPGGDAIDLAKPPAGSYFTPLSNDAGEIVGGVVANLGAAVYLGGSLIMMPEGGLAEQVKNQHPEDVVIEAYEEVVNMLRGVVSNTEGNHHVIPGVSRPLDRGGEDGWIVEAPARLDLSGSVTFGPIQLSILSR
jgi:hypothetical protein